MLEDAAGKQHYQAGSSARIISLVPSLTELLFHLNLQNQLIGRTSSCVEPAEHVAQVAVIGNTRTVDILKLAELGPSHVLVDRDQTPEALINEIINLGVEVVVTQCAGPDDVGPLLELIGDIFGREDQAGELRAPLEAEITATKSATAERVPKTVLYLTWKNPWVTISHGTYTANLLAMAGLESLGHQDGKRYPDVEIDSALLGRTDLVLFGNEPFQFEDEDVQEFQLNHGIGSKPRLEIIDGRTYAWPGLRALQALRGLRELNRLMALL